MKLRTVVFAISALGLAAFFAWGVRGIEPFGHYPGPYGPAVVAVTGTVRHATNAVTTIVMDVRAVDTIAEELIVLAAVVGTIMLLRRRPDEKIVEGHEDAAPPSTALRVVCTAMVGPFALLGLYLVAHGQLTPGGGFQGGVILGAPTAMIFAARRERSFKELHVPLHWEVAQAIALVVFLGFGVAGLLSGAFLKNILPFGVQGTVFSAGTIPVLNVVAGAAVATAIVLIIVEFVHQITEVR